MSLCSRIKAGLNVPDKTNQSGMLRGQSRCRATCTEACDQMHGIAQRTAGKKWPLMKADMVCDGVQTKMQTGVHGSRSV